MSRRTENCESIGETGRRMEYRRSLRSFIRSVRMPFSLNSWIRRAIPAVGFTALHRTAFAQPIAPPHLGPRLDTATFWGILVGLTLATFLSQLGVGLLERNRRDKLPGVAVSSILVFAIVVGICVGLLLAEHPRVLGAATGTIAGLFAFLLIIPGKVRGAGRISGLILFTLIGAACGLWLTN